VPGSAYGRGNRLAGGYAYVIVRVYANRGNREDYPLYNCLTSGKMQCIQHVSGAALVEDGHFLSGDADESKLWEAGGFRGIRL
jgi:hypothetical protein